MTLVSMAEWVCKYALSPSDAWPMLPSDSGLNLVGGTMTVLMKNYSEPIESE